VGPFVVAEERVADEELLAGVNLLLPQLSRHAIVKEKKNRTKIKNN
jgi:hypothetical protein